MTKVCVISDFDLPVVENVTASARIYQAHHQNHLEKTVASLQKNYKSDVHPKQDLSENTIISNKKTKNNNNNIKADIKGGANVISETTTVSGDPASEGNNEDWDNKELSIEAEIKFYQKKAQKRQERFKSILSNVSIEFLWAECIHYPISIIFVGVLATLPFSLIPAHDLVLFPEY